MYVYIVNSTCVSSMYCFLVKVTPPPPPGCDSQDVANIYSIVFTSFHCPYHYVHVSVFIPSLQQQQQQNK